jgi:putrescine---pyruvate transaminase
MSDRLQLSSPLWYPYVPMNHIDNELLVLVEGKGCKVRDQQGNEYIDASGGLWCTQCGLGDDDIIQAIRHQLERLSYGTLFVCRSNEPALKLAGELITMAPPPLKWVYLTGSGSESVELAIKIARLFQALQGRAENKTIVYLDESYHGTFFGSMSVSALTPINKEVGFLPGVSSIMTPLPARCPTNMSYIDFALCCAQELEEKALAGGVAAFIAEPILGSAGVVIPPVEYFRRIEEICRKYGILFIVDEVATGFGRTGKWFASDHFALRPDILLLSKGINSGYLPLGAVLFSGEIGELMLEHSCGIGHGSSHNGNPACCAAALASIQVMRRDHLVERAADSGSYFRERLGELLAFPCVTEIRSLGLMLAVAFVQSDGTPITPSQMYRLYAGLKKRGVLAYPLYSSLAFMPALVITRQEIDTVVHQLATMLGSTRLQNGRVEFLTAAGL